MPVVGSPHQEVWGTPNQPQYPEIVHKEGMKHAAHVTTALDFYFEEMEHKEVIEDINGNKIYNCSIHYPGVKEGITGYVKHMVDIGADILCIDNVFLNYSTQSGDFSEYSMKNFNTYLINRYGIDALKIRV
jgi:hypothetical protein